MKSATPTTACRSAPKLSSRFPSRPPTAKGASINLQRGQFLRVVDGAGSTVTAHAGSVWITEENIVRDVVLREGRSLVLRSRGVALLEAFSDAAVSIQLP
jgi:hypothetical protein